MRRFLPLLLIAFLLAVPGQAQDSPAAPPDPAVQAVREQVIRLEERLTTADRESERLRQEMERVEGRVKEAAATAKADHDRRIGDVERWADWLGIAIAAATAVVAVVGIGLPILAGFKLRDIRRESERTLQEFSASFDKALAAANQKFNQKLEEITKIVSDANDGKSQIDAHLENLKLERPGPSAPADEEQGVRRERAATVISEKPESERTAEDWELLARTAIDDGQYKEAIDFLDRAIGHPDATRTSQSGACFARGIALYRLGQKEDALSAFGMVCILLRTATDARDRTQRANALYNKGVVTGETRGGDAAIAVFNEVIQQYGDDPAPALRDHVASAFLGKGIELAKVKGPVAAIAVFDDLLRRYGDDPAPALREWVATALFNKGNQIAKVEGPAAAIAVYDQVAQRYSDDPAPALRELVAMALVNKGFDVAKADGAAAAIAVYDEVVRRYGDDPALAEVVDRARARIEELRRDGDAPGGEDGEVV